MNSQSNTSGIPDTLARWAAIATIIVLLFSFASWLELRSNFFVTADQRGQRLMDDGEFEKAAETFDDPFRQGIAYFQAGDFESAASVFGGLPGAEAAYNQGNAWVMLGKYDNAIAQFDLALAERPEWRAAQTNRDLAAARAERLKFEGGDMTGGMLGADEIVFDQGKNDSDTDQTETVQGHKPLSDEELRTMWLRQVQTTPSDFLKAKFAYQLAADQQSEQGND